MSLTVRSYGQDSVTDGKEWQRLWSVIKLKKGRGTPEDMDMEDAPAEKGVLDPNTGWAGSEQ